MLLGERPAGVALFDHPVGVEDQRVTDREIDAHFLEHGVLAHAEEDALRLDVLERSFAAHDHGRRLSGCGQRAPRTRCRRLDAGDDRGHEPQHGILPGVKLLRLPVEECGVELFEEPRRRSPGQ